MFLILFFVAETGVVPILLLNFEQKWASCSYKIFLLYKSVIDFVIANILT